MKLEESKQVPVVSDDKLFHTFQFKDTDWLSFERSASSRHKYKSFQRVWDLWRVNKWKIIQIQIIMINNKYKYKSSKGWRGDLWRIIQVEKYTNTNNYDKYKYKYKYKSYKRWRRLGEGKQVENCLLSNLLSPKKVSLPCWLNGKAFAFPQMKKR